MVNQEGIVIWVNPVRWNVPDRRVVPSEGRTLAPLKFRPFRRNFFNFAKVARTRLCGDFQL